MRAPNEIHPLNERIAINCLTQDVPKGIIAALSDGKARGVKELTDLVKNANGEWDVVAHYLSTLKQYGLVSEETKHFGPDQNMHRMHRYVLYFSLNIKKYKEAVGLLKQAVRAAEGLVS